MKKTVLVVGAAGGVGGAVARTLLSRGYAVCGTVLNHAEERSVRAAAPEMGELAILDLSNADIALRRLTELLHRRPLELAGAVVCAAISPCGPLEIIPLAAMRATLEINAVANLAVYQACLPLLRIGKGRLIMISSNAGKAAFPFLGAYVSSKHALEGLCDVMRQEARRFGVDVVLIEPGTMRTKLVTDTVDQVKEDYARLDPDQRALYGAQYRQFISMAHAGHASGMDPGEVAVVICDALDAAAPATRYVVGNDSVELLRNRAARSDREMDDLFEQLYATAASAAPAQ